jgi:CRP-like cAMP-binding protein
MTAHDHEGIRNKILAALPEREADLLFPKLTLVRLQIGTVLNEARERITSAFFLNNGLASFVAVMSDGKRVEVGVTGREGFVGLPLISGWRTSPTRSIIRAACSGFKISASGLAASLPDCPTLATLLYRFGQELALQASLNAACNRCHEVDKRLSKWLLMYQDRLGEDVLTLTHDFLAEILGIRRASVSVAASMLRKAALISYVRGEITVEDRIALERTTCECYGLLNRQIKMWDEES